MRAEAGEGELRACCRPPCPYLNRAWIYKWACCRTRRSVAVSHWGRLCLTHRLSGGRRLVQDSTRVCKQCRRAAGLHRWTRDGRLVRCVATRSGCVAIGAVVGASVVCSIRVVFLTGSQCSTRGIRWRPCAAAHTLKVLKRWGKK